MPCMDTIAAGFDVEAYVRTPQGPMRAQLSGATVEEPELAAVLVYLQHRLQDTGGWLARVLVTATHKNARMTAFLSAWAYERHWLGDALAALAGAETRPTATRRGLLRKLDSRFGPLWAAIWANLHGHSLTGVQMTELLIDSWLLDMYLVRTQELVGATVAADLGRVRSGLARQRVFFQEVALEHLESSPHARTLTRRRLKRRAWPIGAETEPGRRTQGMRQRLFGLNLSWAAELDQRVDALPGLRGLRLGARAA
jgi:hypothetical protein